MGNWRLLLFGVILGLGPLLIHPSTFANAFEPPPNQDAPDSTAGGGSRPANSSCHLTPSEVNDMQAIALAPQSFVGLSSVQSPTLWLYIPNLSISGIEISLFDQDLNGLAQTNLSKPDMPGLIPIELPENYLLSPHQSYYWSAAMICNPNRRTEDWIVGGWIQYQPLASDTSSVANTAPLVQIHRHLETGYWYDALAAMIPSLPIQSDEATASTVEMTWGNLLQQANLNPNVIHLEDFLLRKTKNNDS